MGINYTGKVPNQKVAKSQIVFLLPILMVLLLLLLLLLVKYFIPP